MHRALGEHITLVLCVKELNWKVCFKINDGVRVHEIVEVLLLVSSLTLHDQVLGEDVRSVGRLEYAMLTVELQVPCDDVEALVKVVNQK